MAQAAETAKEPQHPAGDRPELRWKPKTSFHEKKLKSAATYPLFATLKDALNAADRRHKKRNVTLVTRKATGWAAFEYLGTWPCRVAFSQVRIGNLPLGGDPLAPQTYLIDGRGRFAHIVRDEHGYRLAATNRPTEEPTVSSWVDAIVPVVQVNHGKNLSWSPRVTLRPSLDELPATLAWVDQHMPAGTKIKAGGSLHAWSKAAMSNDVYLVPERMKLTRTIDEEPNIYRSDLGDRRGNLIRAGSGNTIREMNRYLWEQRNKALPLLGGYDGQTVGGVFNTGTHGSVFTRGPMAEIIVSIDLVRAGGRLIRLEPTGGITDPAALAKEHPDLELVQNDDYYHAALINMGTMGVVHSYMLEVTDAFHLMEVRTPIKTNDLKKTMRGGKIYTLAGAEGNPKDMENIQPRISDGKDGGFKGHAFGSYHFEVLTNPHSDHIIITSRHPIAVSNDNIFGFDPPGRDLIYTIHLGARFSRPLFPTWVQERFRHLLVWLVDTLMDLFPKITPSLIDRALDSLVDDAYIDRSFNVFNNGAGENRIPALAGSIFIPLENDAWLDALDIIYETAKAFAARNMHETGPASMRFIKGTKAQLGCPRDYCSFEFIFTGKTKWADEVVAGYDLALRARFGNEVRTHWGQLMRDPSHEEMRAMYPEYDRWRAIRDELDPKGCFLNDWQQSILPPLAQP
jgi:FAD binding domain/D-arabinono-1,4-lactone oxidase